MPGSSLRSSTSRPGILLFLRWTLTALLFVAYGVATKMRLPERKDVGVFVLAGLLGFGVYQLLLVFGQQGVSAVDGRLSRQHEPGLHDAHRGRAWPRRGERVHVDRPCRCMGGLVLMGMSKGSFTGSGVSMLLVVAAALSFACYTVISKPLFARYTPMEVTTYAVVAGSVPFLVVRARRRCTRSRRRTAGQWPPSSSSRCFPAASPTSCGRARSRRFRRASPRASSTSSPCSASASRGCGWARPRTPLTVLGGLTTLAGVALAGVRGVPLARRACPLRTSRAEPARRRPTLPDAAVAARLCARLAGVVAFAHARSPHAPRSPPETS